MKQGWVAAVLLVVSTIILLVGCTPPPAASTAVTFTTPYQAVLLSNNSVYFGKLAGFGTPNPVLTDVFYIVTQTDPTTKQSKNILVKRGKELHYTDLTACTSTLIALSLWSQWEQTPKSHSSSAKPASSDRTLLSPLPLWRRARLTRFVMRTNAKWSLCRVRVT